MDWKRMSEYDIAWEKPAVGEHIAQDDQVRVQVIAGSPSCD
jgi:hypothetical protein